MRKRAQLVDETRMRITEAAVRLHTSIGPAATTISAIADEAGVTRLTVYRHFPNLDQLFITCQAHWMQQHPPPDPAAWLEIPGFAQRARCALTDLYGWYAANGDELLPIIRDIDALPPTSRQALDRSMAQLAGALVTGIGVRGRERRHLRAVAGHVVTFWTWRSLAVEQGLSTDEAVDAAVAFLRTAHPRVETETGAGAGDKR